MIQFLAVFTIGTTMPPPPPVTSPTPQPIYTPQSQPSQTWDQKLWERYQQQQK